VRHGHKLGRMSDLVRPEVVQAVEDWYKAYERLYEISMRQLETLKQFVPAEPEQWDQIQEWAVQRIETRDEIESLQQVLINELGIQKVQQIFEQQIAGIVSSTRVVTFEASRMIERAMIVTGSEIQNAKNQRKLANAYSQTEHETVESYFFDEKK